MNSIPARSAPGHHHHDERRGRRLLLAATIAVAALTLGAGPVLAQQRSDNQQRGDQRGGDINYGYEAPPGWRFNPRDVGGAGTLPPVGAQERIAARIEQRRFEGPRQLLRAAGEAVRRDQWGRANELLERAETDVLNMRVARGMVDPELGRAGTGPGGAVVARIGEAREAVVRGDPRRAMRHIDQALARINDAQMFERRDRFAREQYERGYQAGRDSRGMRDGDRFSGRYDNRYDMGASR